jgi:adenylate kinase family enzyme
MNESTSEQSRKIVIFGNSASGKSTLARSLCDAENMAYLDLDNLAWTSSDPPQRALLEISEKAIRLFIQQHDGWVIEGCYTDLLEIVAPQASGIIFMNFPIELCLENAKNRPWEPHKYNSREAQDQNLAMLLWIGSRNMLAYKRR